MKRIPGTLAAAALLTSTLILSDGCETIRQRQFAQDQQFCTSIGAVGDAYTQCMMEHDRNRTQAAAAANTATLNYLAAQQAASQTRTVNCTRLTDVQTTCTSY
jgi:hypothetical protein